MGNPHDSVFPAHPLFVYRALPFPTLAKKDGTHRDSVFKRQPDRESAGLSVAPSIGECKALFKLPIYGIRRVNVRALREYGLDLFPDSPSHANIRFRDGTNIPAKNEPTPKVAEIAEALMNMSEQVTHWDAENADESEEEFLRGRANSN